MEQERLEQLALEIEKLKQQWSNLHQRLAGFIAKNHDWEEEEQSYQQDIQTSQNLYTRITTLEQERDRLMQPTPELASDTTSETLSDRSTSPEPAQTYKERFLAGKRVSEAVNKIEKKLYEQEETKRRTP